MFACIQGRSVSTLPAENDEMTAALVDLAFTFSPLVELTMPATVVLDISGQDLLFGNSTIPSAAKTRSDEMTAATNVAAEISRCAQQLKLKVDVAVAANPDVAVHAARSFTGSTTIINRGEERLRLARAPIRNLDFTLAGIDPHRTVEIQETFSLWGIRTFDDLAKLPFAGVAERLGQEGLRLQKLAQGKTERQLNLVRPPIGFAQSFELEHPVEELEPLAFILSRLLNQLCANLLEYAQATNELTLVLVTDPRHLEVTAGSTAGHDCLHQRTITLPVPMQDPKTLLRLLLFDIEAQPPQAPVIAVTIRAEPVQPRASQTGLFIPLAPEPEKLEITLARLGKLVGPDHVGSPELLDTHRPDAFRLKRFTVTNRPSRPSRKSGKRHAASGNQQCVMGFRVFRPPWRAEVQTNHGQPVRINAHAENSSNRLRGKVGRASGPWRASGDWWRADVWARDEWDVGVRDANNQQDEVICRIYRDLTSDKWFVAGIYD
jgi:protein ImuB